MNRKSSAHEIKREQKKSFLLQQISSLILTIAQDEPSVAKVFVTRVDLSSDGGVCYVYLSTFGSPETFEEALELLKLYKPSLRRELAKRLQSRYVPNIRFEYDTVKDRTRKLDTLLEQISAEQDESEPESSDTDSE